MRKNYRLGFLISVLILATIPALADEPVANCATTDFVSDLTNGDWKQYVDTGSGKEGPSTRGTCSATCQYGSASTSCRGTCTAVDQNCSAGQRGYVSCNGTIVDRCNPCPLPACTVQQSCDDGSTVSCSSSNNYCSSGSGGGGGGWVRCDGVFEFCPCVGEGGGFDGPCLDDALS